jgi:two-component system, NarL family, sensor kinase
VKRRRPDSVIRTVALFSCLGLILLVLVGVVGVTVLRRVSTDQALADARDLTARSANIVERRLDDGIVQAGGDVDAEVRVAAVVAEAVLHYPVVAVRIWSPTGEVLFADVDGSRLIGHSFPASVAGLSTLAEGEVRVGTTDLSQPPNDYLQPDATLLDSFTPVATRGGTPLLFEMLQRSSSVSQGERELLTTFAPVLLVALAVFAILVVPLVWALAVRLQRAARDRARLLEETIDVTDRERRRIAADLHDGPVQQLAGLAMNLSAQATRADDGADSDALREAAEAVRSSVRTLRSAIVGIYPPNLDAEGLGQALSDLTARLSAQGLDVVLHMDEGVGYGPAVDRLLYRAAQEGLRNVEAHASARRVDVTVQRDGGNAVLVVRDNGSGMTEEDAFSARQDGHVGLGILRDLVLDAGGELTVAASDDGGTMLHVEVPA